MIFDEGFWNSLNNQWNWLKYNIVFLRYVFYDTLRWSWDNISQDPFTLKLEIKEGNKSLNMTFLIIMLNKSNSIFADFEYSVFCFFVLDRESFTSPHTLINSTYFLKIVPYILKNISRLLSQMWRNRKISANTQFRSKFISDLFIMRPRHLLQLRCRQIVVDFRNHSLYLHDVTFGIFCCNIVAFISSLYLMYSVTIKIISVISVLSSKVLRICSWVARKRMTSRDVIVSI